MRQFFVTSHDAANSAAPSRSLPPFTADRDMLSHSHSYCGHQTNSRFLTSSSSSSSRVLHRNASQPTSHQQQQQVKDCFPPKQPFLEVTSGAFGKLCQTSQLHHHPDRGTHGTTNVATGLGYGISSSSFTSSRSFSSRDLNTLRTSSRLEGEEGSRHCFATPPLTRPEEVTMTNSCGTLDEFVEQLQAEVTRALAEADRALLRQFELTSEGASLLCEGSCTVDESQRREASQHVVSLLEQTVLLLGSVCEAEEEECLQQRLDSRSRRSAVAERTNHLMAIANVVQATVNPAVDFASFQPPRSRDATRRLLHSQSNHGGERAAPSRMVTDRSKPCGVFGKG